MSESQITEGQSHRPVVDPVPASPPSSLETAVRPSPTQVQAASSVEAPTRPPEAPSNQTLDQILEALQRAKEVETLRAEMSSMTYFLLTVIDGEGARVVSHSSREDLVSALREMIDSGIKAQAYLFYGSRLNVSRGQFKYLLDGDERIPLFDDSESSQIDETGTLIEEEVAD